MVANLKVINALWRATPADFRFPILDRLNTLASKYVDMLEMQMVTNPPMSMLKIKDVCHQNQLDLCPLIFQAFGDFCKEFLTEIHGSDFCVPNSAKLTDTAYIVGFGIRSFEDRAGLFFRNANRKITETISLAEMRAAKDLADKHKQQDDLMRAIWNAIQVSPTQWMGPPPVVPKITKIYNECEPQVVGKTAAMFEWYERPCGPTKAIVLEHVPPILDEVPQDLSKFPNIARYLPLVGRDDRKSENLEISPIQTPTPSDTSINKSNPISPLATPSRTVRMAKSKRIRQMRTIHSILTSVQSQKEKKVKRRYTAVKMKASAVSPVRRSRRIRKLDSEL